MSVYEGRIDVILARAGIAELKRIANALEKEVDEPEETWCHDCVRKDKQIAQLTAERDALREQLDIEIRTRNCAQSDFLSMERERDALREATRLTALEVFRDSGAGGCDEGFMKYWNSAVDSRIALLLNSEEG